MTHFNVFNNNVFANRFFRKVDNLCWDLMTGKIGFLNDEGSIVSIDLGTVSEDNKSAPDAQVTINPIAEFGMNVPAFAQSTSIADIKLGDLIVANGSDKMLGWVVKIKDKKFTLMRPSGTSGDWTAPKVQMLGFDSGVLVIRQMLNMMPNGASSMQNFQSQMLPILMMSGNSDMDIEAMMPMMLLMQTGMIGNPNDSSGIGNMMQTMLLMQMLNKNSNVDSSKATTTGTQKREKPRSNVWSES